MSSLKETDDESSMSLDLNLQLHLGNDNTLSPKEPSVATPKASEWGAMCGLHLSLSMGSCASVITSVAPVFTQYQNSFEASKTVSAAPPIEEGSRSSHWKSGVSFQPSSSVQERSSIFLLNRMIHDNFCPVQAIPGLSSSLISVPQSSVTFTSGITHTHQHSVKSCQFQGCGKGARVASGLCTAHGGGGGAREGWQKGADSRTVYCKAHGGGHRCQYLGGMKSAEGHTDYCITHGGGRRCSHEVCTRAARGKSGLCIKHGGGKRCQREYCTRSAEGYSGVCISHGGGHRCQFPNCSKGAQGSTIFCKAHGGGRRCTVLGCTKGAEGSTPFCKGHGGGKRCSFNGEGVCPKSVHGGTLYCVAHGGGKRCRVPECTKSARGRTDFCVRHGGGKRCKSEGCAKSTQGRTDFCKAHDGGNRCSWGKVGSDFGGGDPPCDQFARGKTGLCAEHTTLVQDCHVHGGGTLGSVPVQASQPNDLMMIKEVNMEDVFVGWNNLDKKLVNSAIPFQSSTVSLQERRVHGGSLMVMLASGAELEKTQRKTSGGKSFSSV